MTQHNIVSKSRTRVWKGDDIREVLEDWRIRRLVQKFVTKPVTSKRPVTIWRATNLLPTAKL
jgi:hypothetical protein